MLSCPFGKQGCFYVSGTGMVIKLDEIRVWHFGTVELSVAASDGGIDGGRTVILPLPFVTHQSRGAENLIDHLRIGTGTKRDHGTQSQIRFRVGAVLTVVAGIIKRGEFVAVFLLAKIADNVKHCPISVSGGTVLDLLCLPHILIQGSQHSGGAIL